LLRAVSVSESRDLIACSKTSAEPERPRREKRGDHDAGIGTAQPRAPQNHNQIYEQKFEKDLAALDFRVRFVPDAPLHSPQSAFFAHASFQQSCATQRFDVPSRKLARWQPRVSPGEQLKNRGAQTSTAAHPKVAFFTVCTG
jgi:hypothetical protein